MDIHRCRFVPYQPQAINALAFSHSSNPKQHTPKDLRLAVGRTNGDIELWNPNQGQWVQERILRGGLDRTVEQVQWTQDLIVPDEEDIKDSQIERGHLRLFSSGGSTSITEWDVQKGTPKRHAEGNSDDIWCFAPQPQWTEGQVRNSIEQVRTAPSQLLAAGCADGSIILFSTIDNELRFTQFLIRAQSTKKSRCISITWRDRNTVVAGFEQSQIRVIDVRSRRTIRTMTLGKTADTAQPLVWALKCLPNGTILSGDSSGELKIWDAQNYSLVQRLKTHIADILDITTNTSGTMILTCGVDRRTVAYAPQSGTGNVKTQRWYEIRHRRFHEHDVKAITAFESKSMSIAVSGGIDTVPVVLPLKRWNEEYHRSLPHLPQKPQMSASSEARLMLTWCDSDLFIWHIPQQYQEPTDSESVSDEFQNQKLLAQIRLSGEEHITSAEISSNGTMVAAATSSGVRLFQIRRSTSASGQAEVRSRPVDLPTALAAQGATVVGFSPDSKWLAAVRLNNVVLMVKVIPPGAAREKPSLHPRVIKLDRKRRKVQAQQESALGTYANNISTLSFAPDSRILAVGDLSGAIDTWVLEGHEAVGTSETIENGAADSSASEDSDSDSDDETDSRVVHGQQWIRTPAGSQLPSLGSAVLALTFKPSLALPDHPSRTHGNEGLHPTRHNHHPVAPEHPPVDAGYLFAVTANHQVVEFDTINCRLTDWSRRNPNTTFPDQFRKIKDRVMGAWVDLRPSEHIERLWLYGSTFLFMLDVKRDLAKQTGQDLVKVGRLGQHVIEVPSNHALARNEHIEQQQKSKKRKRNAGAGGEMRYGQKYSADIDISIDGDDDVSIKVDIPSPPESIKQEDDLDDDDMMDIDDEVDKKISGSSRQDAVVQKEDQEADSETETQYRSQPASWHTFLYRGIYGLAVLGQAVDNDAAPEVVIVERPMFDVELSPRFMGGQEW
ncbi:U3 small nucleolar RNA-associated protein [Lithohypha guttulata]|uniref:U3 small nucleolar RNA-associated protein n=1 Tax=Lithohypha guttulata TaxID=1690604 RepID=A0AAN7SVH6_9EURO|nr:U3 small nucleolar RNA-associated protein [Lithohypha guttulata]